MEYAVRHILMPNHSKMRRVFITTLFFLMVLFSSFAATCGGPTAESIRPDANNVLVSFLQFEYEFHNLYVPPRTAFVLKDTSSDYYWFWDGGHLAGNSDSICATCAGRALNTGDRMYSGIALLDWDRHTESYTTNLGTYADSVVEKLASLGWDTDSWPWPPLISSAWRNPDRNARIPGSLDTSLHMFGRAIDFEGNNDTQLQLLSDAVEGQEEWL